MNLVLSYTSKIGYTRLMWLCFIGLWALALLTGWLNPFSHNNDRPSKEDVNLSIRRATHRLLLAAGDSVSRIPPVEQISERTWRVQLDPSFKYDSLPSILQSAFDAQHIDEEYNVSIMRCTDDFIQLGYSKFDLSNPEGVPCKGRTLDKDCYKLQVHFAKPASSTFPFTWVGYFLGSAGVLFFFIRSWGRRQYWTTDTDLASATELRFGNSRLDEANRVLFCGEVRHQLTYREAKLMHLFAQHPNVALERSLILDKVWADEGILVGRSVDMFVSRLRKFLADDPSIRLVAVHGIGYKMEVSL